MTALSFAFETIIVGALALPWLVLAAYLFFPEEVGQIYDFLSSDKSNSAVAGVLLTALAFSLGAAVSRIAQDFFNDDDLPVLRVTAEESIRTSVYCSPNPDEPWLFDNGISPQFPPVCQEDSQENHVRRIFHVQESTLLLEGEDKTVRLRQLREQIVVLQGAAFNGLVALALCVFGWCANQRPKVRQFSALVPFGIALAGCYALCRHLQFRVLSDPPYMEFTLFVLGFAGMYALRKGAQGKYAAGVWISLLFTVMAWFGWWWTEVLYDECVIYSFYALNHTLPK